MTDIWLQKRRTDGKTVAFMIIDNWKRVCCRSFYFNCPGKIDILISFDFYPSHRYKIVSDWHCRYKIVCGLAKCENKITLRTCLLDGIVWGPGQSWQKTKQKGTVSTLKTVLLTPNQSCNFC